ncbi:MAG: hypothetical protein TREMPRED_001187 [Tremellales sp. Tagirdzhanova-0007]|nr:MAG: hypothetical protein TREMPRED_001187 [Tremellales sp. Tagirdzhanova-0007]
MHAHAFDLLSLSSGRHAPPRSLLSPPARDELIPASVPSKPTSFLSATRPPSHPIGSATNTNLLGASPRPRRMSSSTTGVLGRGKLGVTGEGTLGLGGVGKDARPSSANHATSYSGVAPALHRRPGAVLSSSPIPQLFDFATIDRHPSQSYGRPPFAVPMKGRSVSTSVVPASLPDRGYIASRAPQINLSLYDDAELDMDFDGDEEYDEEGDSGRSGSADMDMDMEGVDENTKEEWRDGLQMRELQQGIPPPELPSQASLGAQPALEGTRSAQHEQASTSPDAGGRSTAAAAILAHLDSTAGRALPHDKSLWPAILSPSGGEHAQLRRLSRDYSAVRSLPSSAAAPLTPSSLRETSNLGIHGEQISQKGRKSSPGTDSTTSSVGESHLPPPRSSSPLFGSLGIRSHGDRLIRPVNGETIRPNSSLSSSVPGPPTPYSTGSLPDMTALHFHTGSTPSGVSPIPNRGMPSSLKTRAGMIGGGMFGGTISTSVQSSSIRSGADDDEDLPPIRGSGGGQSSSEEAEDRRRGREGEDWGMAMEMEL